MDIQITGIQDPGDGFLYIERTLDGGELPHLHKMPKEMLAIRSAEYNLPVDDPRALDIVLMEIWVEEPPGEKYAPLYSAPTVEDALEIIMQRVEDAKTRHGAPEQPQMRSLFHAADLPESTQGLTDVKAKLLEHADPEFQKWVHIHRDAARESIRTNMDNMSFAERMKMEALNIVHDKAIEEHTSRELELAKQRGDVI
jgi:hypothetical protein